MNEILMCGTDPVGQLYKDTKAEATSIAPIEVSPAESSHNVGTHIMYGGIRYKVTSSISIGDTLTIGTNISAENVEDSIQIVDNLTSTATDKALSAKQGKVLNDTKAEIKSKDVTISTNAQGVADLGSTFFKNKKVIDVYAPNNQYIILPFTSTLSGGFTWYVKILNFYNLNPIEANDIDLIVQYVD